MKKCYTCGKEISEQSNISYTRFNHSFCSHHCMDIFDERNDYGGVRLSSGGRRR